jgi:hypothetical protein
MEDKHASTPVGEIENPENIAKAPKHPPLATLHRAGRVLSFFSSRRNKDSPNPSPAGECPPGPFLGGGAHSLAREGLRGSQFRRGHIHCGTHYIYVLCAPLPPYYGPIFSNAAVGIWQMRLPRTVYVQDLAYLRIYEVKKEFGQRNRKFYADK